MKTLEMVEKEYIRQVLVSLSFNYTQSARVLGISLSTLKRKVKQFCLKKDDNNEENTDR